MRLCYAMSAYLCVVKQFPPYLHNGTKYKVTASYAITTGKRRRRLSGFCLLDTLSRGFQFAPNKQHVVWPCHMAKSKWQHFPPAPSDLYQMIWCLWGESFVGLNELYNKWYHTLLGFLSLAFLGCITCTTWSCRANWVVPPLQLSEDNVKNNEGISH